MSSLHSLISILLAVLYFLVILFTGIDFKKRSDLSFYSIETTWYSKKSVIFTASLPFIIPVLMLLKSSPFNFGNNFLMVAGVYFSLLIFYVIIYWYSKHWTAHDGNPGDQMESNSIYSSYVLVSNLGLKLPIIVWGYALILESLLGDLGFVIVIVLITISGLLLMSNGLAAFIRTGVITGVALFISLIGLSLCKIPENNLLVLNQLFPHATTIGAGLHPLWYFGFIFVLAGIWINDIYYSVRYIYSPQDSNKRRNIFFSSVILFGFFILVVILMNKYNEASIVKGTEYGGVSLIGLKYNGFGLIVISGLFMLGLMTILQSVARVIVVRIIAKQRRNTSPNGSVLISRLIIVMSVALTVLLTPVFTVITFQTFRIMMLIYISISLPVLALFLYSIMSPRLRKKTVSIMLLCGWLPGLIILSLILSNRLEQIHWIQFFVIQLLYSIFCVFLFGIGTDQSLFVYIKNKLLARRANASKLTIKP